MDIDAMAGLYFEQFEANQVFRHDIRRTVTETDNVATCKRVTLMHRLPKA